MNEYRFLFLSKKNTIITIYLVYIYFMILVLNIYCISIIMSIEKGTLVEAKVRSYNHCFFKK